MSGQEFKYDVFISYRQLGPDRSIADRLHTLLEKYRTPRTLVRVGVAKRLGRVFRDTDELAASSNLGESIESALRESRFLIVLCSLRTRESKWVSREIEFFRQLGRSNRILPLLIEGEPETSFPGQLFDALSERAEPLAADIRATSLSQSLKLLRREMLRFVAPILGVDFAELDQRETKRRRLRVVSAVVAALITIAVTVGIWYQEKLNTLEQEQIAQTEARLARSRDLSDLAQAQVGSDLALSLLLSIEANRSAETLQSRSSLLEGLQSASGAIATLRGHGSPVKDLAISPTGSELVSSGYDGQLILWDMITKQQKLLLSTDDYDAVKSIAFASIGTVFASAVMRSGLKLELWNRETWDRVAELPFSSRMFVGALVISSDGQKAHLLNPGFSVSTWATKDLTKLSEHHGRWHVLIGNQKGTVLAVGRGGEMLILDGGAFEVRNELRDALATRAERSVQSAALASDGDRLVLDMFDCASDRQAGDRESCLMIWSIAGNRFLGEPLRPQELPDYVALSGDGSLLAAGTRGEPSINVWHIDTASSNNIEIGNGAVTALAFSPQNNRIYVGTSAGEIRVWDDPDGISFGHRITDHGQVGWAASVDRKGEFLAAGSRNSALLVWDLAKERLIRERFSGHDGRIDLLAFSSGTDRFASAGSDGTIVVRDTKTTNPVASPIDADPRSIDAMAISSDGRLVAWWSNASAELTVFDVDSSREIISAKLPVSSSVRPYELRFSEADTKVVFMARDCSVFEWDLESEVMRDLVQFRQTDKCRSIAASSEHGLVALGLNNGDISLWSYESLRKIGELRRGHRNPVDNLTFVPGQDALISGDGIHIVRWELRLASWMTLACRIANRNLSEEEWGTYFTGETFRETCGPWGQFVPPTAVSPPEIETRPIIPSDPQ